MKNGDIKEDNHVEHSEKVSEYKDFDFEEQFKKISKSVLESFNETKAESFDNESSSSSDIEYDGTNIPELNLDFDVSSYINSQKELALRSHTNRGNESELSDTLKTSAKDTDYSSCSYSSSQFINSELCKSDAVSRHLSTTSSRQSIFENFKPSYDSLYQQLLSQNEQSENEKKKPFQTIKVCPFLGISSFDVEPILHKEDEANISSDIEHARSSERLSEDFYPELISARSSSFKSSLASHNATHMISSIHDKTVALTMSSSTQPLPEDLENEVLSGSCFLSPDSQVTFGNMQATDSPILNVTRNQSENDLSKQADLTRVDVSGIIVEGENWGSRLGISDAEFFNSDAAKELMKKQTEEFDGDDTFDSESANKVSLSNWSPQNRLEITAPSWISSSVVQNSDRHISFGAFINARSEQLGTLSEDTDRERPYFGTAVLTPTKSSSSFSYDEEQLNLESELGKFRPSALSDIFNSISFSDPLNFASKNVDAFSAVVKNYLQNEETTSSDNSKFYNDEDQKGLSSYSLRNIEESGSTLVRSVSENNLSNQTYINSIGSDRVSDSTQSVENSINFHRSASEIILTKQADIDPIRNDRSSEPTNSAESSLNCSSVGSTCEKDSIKTDKSNVCSNSSLSASQRSGVQDFSRPVSACSSTCHNPISLPNAFSMQYRCMKHLHPQEPSQCMIPNNYLFLQNSNPGLCAQMCPMCVLQYNQMSSQSTFSGSSGSMIGPISGSSHLGGIEAPSRLCFPEKISLGDSQEMNLTIKNPVNMAGSYQISFLSAYLNGLPIALEMSGLSYTKTVPSTSESTTDIKLILSPRFEGNIEVNLQVDAISHTVSQTLSTRTKIEFEALRPCISLSSKYKDNLNLGPIIAGSTFVEYVTLVNKCEVSVPLRISLANDSIENQVYFDPKEIDRQNNPNCGRPTFLSPKVILYRLPGTKNISLPSHLDIPIVFESIRGQINSTITAAIETPTLSVKLAFIQISVTAGVARLVLKDKSQNPLRLKASKASTSSHSLTVINEGTIPVVYDLQIESESNCFTVSPNSLNLQPQQSSTISITYSPLISQAVKGILLAAAQPNGQVFTMTEIFGEVITHLYAPVPSNPRQFLTQPTRDFNDSTYESSTFIECNKKYLAWGGADIGRTIIKTFTVRNPRREEIQARIFIKDKSQAFQIIDHSGLKTLQYNFTLNAKEAKEISVAFTPKGVASYSSILLMKPLVVENERTSYSIPMSGYGGTSRIKVLCLPDGEGLSVDLSSDTEIVHKNIVLQNTGYRAAFVKLLITYDGIVQNPMEKQTVIHPSEFVLMENEKKNILISINCLNKTYASSDEIICILYGDEILRQRLKKKCKSDPENNIYNIDFTVPYDGENKVPYDSYVFSPKDDSLFYTSIKKLMVHIFFNAQNASFSRQDFTVLSAIQDSFSNLTFNSTVSSRRLTIEGHSPPVKESAFRNTNRLSLPIPFDDNLLLKPAVADPSPRSFADEIKNLKLQTWAVSPEEIILDSESKDNRILLKSYSNLDMRYKVKCTIDVISVSTIIGTLAANKEIALRLTLINSNHSKLFEDYQGILKVQCDGMEKIVKVKVLKDQKKMKRLLQQIEVSNFLQLPPSQDVNLSLRSGYLGDSLSMDNTVIEMPSSEVLKVENITNFPKIVDLKKTRLGFVFELKLDVGNASQNAVTWNIHPTSILFTEPFDDSIDCTSPAIEFVSTSGTIKPMESVIIPVKFSPLCIAKFSQFFELSLSVENGIKENCRFKVQGEAVPDAATVSSTNLESTRNSLNVKKTAKADLFVEKEICEFRSVAPGQRSIADIKIKNISAHDCKLTIVKPQPPFMLNHASVTVKSQKYLKITVYFKPMKPSSCYESDVKFVSDNGLELKVRLKGSCS